VTEPLPHPPWWRRTVRLWRDLGPVGLLLALASLGPAVGGALLLGTLRQLGPWLRAHGHAGLPTFTLLATVLTALALMPTYALSLLAGWAFGWALGFAAVLTAHTAAAALAAAGTRQLAGGRVIRLIDQHPRWRAVYRTLLGAGFGRSLLIVTLVRLPSSPFALTNVVLASARVPWGVYLLATVVGLAPRTFLEVWLGAQVRTLDFHSQALVTHALLSAVAGILLLVILGLLADRALRRVTR
jgi:uncharacterized membrane protein YdjX (TVP38/TMEM64 family)